MATKIKILNGPTDVTVEEMTYGSKFSIGIYVEKETSTPDVFAPFDYTGIATKCIIKKSEKEADTALIGTLTVVPRVGSPGWADIAMDGTATAALGVILGHDKDMHASLKVWPTGQEAVSSETLAVFTIHGMYRSTR